MKSKKGFTLIELLVVIAIIGILAAIVLVALRGAPARAKDARIKSGVNQARSQAELIWTDDSDYDNLCAADNTLDNTNATLDTLEVDIAGQQGEDLVADVHLRCYVSGTDKYCVSARLVNDTDQWFCVDSAGRVVDNGAETLCDSAAECQ